MTPEQFRNLKPGDLVRHATNPVPYVVHANYGGRATALRHEDLTNPIEWLLIDSKGRIIEDPIKRFPDGKEKPWLSPEKYAELRNDDQFLYNECVNHDWQYTGYDRGGSHKGEDHYQCWRCKMGEYRP